MGSWTAIGNITSLPFTSSGLRKDPASGMLEGQSISVRLSAESGVPGSNAWEATTILIGCAFNSYCRLMGEYRKNVAVTDMMTAITRARQIGRASCRERV